MNKTISLTRQDINEAVQKALNEIFSQNGTNSQVKKRVDAIYSKVSQSEGTLTGFIQYNKGIKDLIRLACQDQAMKSMVEKACTYNGVSTSLQPLNEGIIKAAYNGIKDVIGGIKSARNNDPNTSGIGMVTAFKAGVQASKDKRQAKDYVSEMIIMCGPRGNRIEPMRMFLRKLCEGDATKFDWAVYNNSRNTQPQNPNAPQLQRPSQSYGQRLSIFQALWDVVTGK